MDKLYTVAPATTFGIYLKNTMATPPSGLPFLNTTTQNRRLKKPAPASLTPT